MADPHPRKHRVYRLSGIWAAALALSYVVAVNLIAPLPDRAAGDNADPSDAKDHRAAKIIGEDDRVVVEDTLIEPWIAIGRVRARWGNVRFVGTGVMISPRHVLTAAHCVYKADRGGWADHATFTPAADGDFSPFGDIAADRFHAPTEYVNGKQQAFDVAVITLEEPVGEQTGWMDIAEDESYGVGTYVYTAGYPADADDDHMYAAAGLIDEIIGGLVYYQLDTTIGQSGSPVWSTDGNTGSPRIVAVHTARLLLDDFNIATPIVPEIREYLTSWLAEGTGTDTQPGPGADQSLAVGAPGESAAAAACGAGMAPFALFAAAGLTLIRARRR